MPANLNGGLIGFLLYKSVIAAQHNLYGLPNIPRLHLTPCLFIVAYII